MNDVNNNMIVPNESPFRWYFTAVKRRYGCFPIAAVAALLFLASYLLEYYLVIPKIMLQGTQFPCFYPIVVALGVIAVTLIAGLIVRAFRKEINIVDILPASIVLYSIMFLAQVFVMGYSLIKVIYLVAVFAVAVAIILVRLSVLQKSAAKADLFKPILKDKSYRLLLGKREYLSFTGYYKALFAKFGVGILAFSIIVVFAVFSYAMLYGLGAAIMSNKSLLIGCGLGFGLFALSYLMALPKRMQECRVGLFDAVTFVLGVSMLVGILPILLKPSLLKYVMWVGIVCVLLMTTRCVQLNTKAEPKVKVVESKKGFVAYFKYLFGKRDIFAAVLAAALLTLLIYVVDYKGWVNSLINGSLALLPMLFTIMGIAAVAVLMASVLLRSLVGKPGPFEALPITLIVTAVVLAVVFVLDEFTMIRIFYVAIPGGIGVLSLLVRACITVIPVAVEEEEVLIEEEEEVLEEAEEAAVEEAEETERAEEATEEAEQEIQEEEVEEERGVDTYAVAEEDIDETEKTEYDESDTLLDTENGIDLDLDEETIAEDEAPVEEEISDEEEASAEEEVSEEEAPVEEEVLEEEAPVEEEVTDEDELLEEELANEELPEEEISEELTLEDAPYEEEVSEEAPEEVLEETDDDTVDMTALAAIAEVDNSEEEGEDELSTADNDDDNEDANDLPTVKLDVFGERFFVRYSRSFMAKLIQAEDPIQEYYTAIKNKLLSYKGVKARVSWPFESFNRGREKLAKMSVRGKKLCLYLGLDPEPFANTKYHVKDMREKKKYAEVPMLLRVRSRRSLAYALEIIDMLAEVFELKDNARAVAEDYKYPYESSEALLERGLIKKYEAKQGFIGGSDNSENEEEQEETLTEEVEESVIADENAENNADLEPTEEEIVVEEIAADEQQDIEEEQAEEEITQEVVEEQPIDEAAEDGVEEVTEAQPEEEIVEEQPIEEAIEAQPEEEIIEEQPIEEAVEESVENKAEAAANEDLDKTEEVKKSFRASLVSANEDIRDYYSEVKNELLSYGFACKEGTYRETYKDKKEDFVIAKMRFSGSSLRLYLAIDPTSLSEEYYHHKDVRDKKSYEEVPTMLGLKSKLAVKKTKMLIKIIADTLGIEKKADYQDKDYGSIEDEE